MKKIILFVIALLGAVVLQAASYGILVNGKMYYEATPLGNKDYQGRDQFLASISLQQGDTWCVYDATNKAPFVVAMEAGNGSAKGNFTEGSEYATCNVAGCYDFYIKLKWQDNSMWVQNGSSCNATGVDISGGGQGGGGDDPGDDPTEDDVLWYAIGWINGGDHGEAAYDVYEDDYLFEEDGKLTIDCRMGSYIAIKDHMGNFYYSKTPTTIADERVTMEWANGWTGCQKWAIPEGINYIIVRSASFKNKIVLERVDKATYDAYHYSPGQGIEQVITSTKARKAIIDGQLRIIRGNKIFDATGREL